MKNEHEIGADVEHKPARQPIRSVPTSLEATYDRLTSYGFARRYVEGSVVADIGWSEVGYGTHLLADTAESVVGLTSLSKAAERASTAYSSPNVSYQRVSLPELPFPQGHFDIVVALGIVENLEHPEDLIREAKRVLKQDGLLLISALDKQTNSNDRNLDTSDDRREMYVPEFRELLEHYFQHVRLYRQGVVAGGYVFPASGEASDMVIESAQLSSTTPNLSTENPFTHSVIAVCGDAEASRREQPYLLLDRDRRVFDECEERAEDVELLRDEIQRMQETEVQAFLTTLQSYESRAGKAVRGLTHVRNLVYGAKRRLFNSRRQGS
jgi:2-polyprenyl-3-methyl-5-hydroxy-6-metoxy-1,4-benzoquinol methylase